MQVPCSTFHPRALQKDEDCIFNTQPFLLVAKVLASCGHLGIDQAQSMKAQDSAC